MQMGNYSRLCGKLCGRFVDKPAGCAGRRGEVDGVKLAVRQEAGGGGTKAKFISHCGIIRMAVEASFPISPAFCLGH